jgi:hypothetical protein
MLSTCVIRTCIRGNAAAIHCCLNEDGFRVRAWRYDGGTTSLESGISVCVGGDVAASLRCLNRGNFCVWAW